ncbi:DALR anticodon-binding domain-containing protein [Streptomyces sp. HNM0663]|uniref:arginine--tRNA ligase n=1 Tax=Streptomyces chengmaiensis TaxID=3040919 RepID=A0ABT6HHM6_9ACTN|nr:DALR anticodon-binding domain-containing protein [Streptomyces chengmaiensis]MDH2387364.1 DALR anticodon-binding domain-containing protein [Streptomyces chengmaiensis]
MTPAELSRTVRHAVRRAVDEGALRVAVPDSVKIEPSRPGGRGDYASAVALRLAGAAGKSPREVAEVLRERVECGAGIEAVHITGVGFLNFTLGGETVPELLRRVREQGERYGYKDGDGDGGKDGYGGGGGLAGQPVVLRTPRELRARVMAETLVRLLRSQGAPAELSDAETSDAELRDSELRDAEIPDAKLRDAETSDAELRGIELRDAEIPDAKLRDAETSDAELRGIELRDAGEAVRVRGVDDQDLLRRLGDDAGRWALLRAAPGDRPQTRSPLLQKEENGLFRVQYAASRARALTRGAAQLGFASRYERYEEDVRCADVSQGIRDYPAVLASAARLRSPDRLARHLEALADALLAFQHTVLPRGDEKPSAAHRSRLALAEAAGTVLAGGLGLLGVSAPEYV